VKYILDACALLAVSNKEKGADAVQKLLNQAEAGGAGIYISVINLLEVYYKLIRQKGPESASVFVKSILYASPVKIVDTVPFAVFSEAAGFKTAFKVSLADAIGLATASCMGGVFVTADHHEMDAIDQAARVPFLWIR
jgi:predicted nucleic acid-binding protein